MFSAEKTENKYAGIFYGKTYGYAIAAPKGWVLDNDSKKNNGLQVVFYPEGSSWNHSDSVMYINISLKKDKQGVKDIVKNDVDGFMKRNKGLKVYDAPDVKVDEKVAIVKYFQGHKGNAYEAVGCLDDEKVVIMFVLSSKMEKDFKSSLPAFEELLHSYFRMEVKIEQGVNPNYNIIFGRDVVDEIKKSGDRKLNITK